MPETLPGLWPTITFVAGFALKEVADWLRDGRLSRREMAARHDARRDLLRQRRSDFQRQNLLELQDTLMKFSRKMTEITIHDEQAFRETGQWRRALLPEEVNEGSRLTLVAMSTLSVRVRDAEVRRLAEEVRNLSDGIIGSTGPDASEAVLARPVRSHLALNTRIGEVLRTLDDEEDAISSG